MGPRKFAIEVPAAVLDDLAERLARTRWPDPAPSSPWSAGANVGYVRELCEHWRTEYDWRRQEAELNRHPQYLCEVDGVDLHFWHVRGRGPDPVPLLLLHGWPGSIYEFHHLIGPLTDPAAHGGDPGDAVHAVVAALPGFGFGGAPREPGWGLTRIATAFHRLMTEALGYERYAIQGGDWGALIGSKMASAHPAHVLGLHLNFVLARAQVDPEQLARPRTDGERAAAEARRAFEREETGYSNVQGTKPWSVGIAHADSPAGLAAWIVEKFRTWSDCDGDVERVFTKDQLLTNLMFYWAPNRAASAASLYREARLDPAGLRYPRVEVPTAVAAFPREVLPAPRSWVEPRYRVVRWTEMPRGGHFPALEQPELLLADVRAFLRELR